VLRPLGQSRITRDDRPGHARAEWHGERRRAIRGASGRPAAQSAYAALVRLVEQAQARRAPFMRMADRYRDGLDEDLPP
jgi:hypothetical protein